MEPAANKPASHVLYSPTTVVDDGDRAKVSIYDLHVL
jgi:hypothetical protein